MKKKLILGIACMLAAQISMAQTQKSAQTLGGSLSFSTRTADGYAAVYNSLPVFQKNNYTSFSIGPAYSFFIADQLELGGSLQFSTTTNKSNNLFGTPNTDIKQASTNIGGSLSLLKYCMFDKIGLRMGPYIGYSRGADKITTTGSPITSTTNTNTYNAGARLDLVYYPSKTLGFAASLANLGYSKAKSNNDYNQQLNGSAENFNANFITNNLGLSVFYVFGNK